MSRLSVSRQCLIAGGLAVFMLVTRSPGIPGSELLHSGSWAVFFIAGLYLESALALPAFLALAFAIDAVALGWGGVSDYCLTPAYAMLIPAYGCLWGAGHWYASRYPLSRSSLTPLIASVFAGAVACEAFASASFYWLSGRFSDPSLGVFAVRELHYFPAYLATLFFWVGATVLMHRLLAAANSRAAGHTVG